MITPPLVVLTSRALAIPTIAAQLDNQTTIGRRSTHGATDSLQHHAAVQSSEIDRAIYFRDRDAAVVRFDVKDLHDAERTLRS